MKRQQNYNVKKQTIHHWRAPNVMCPLSFLSGDIPLMNVGYRKNDGKTHQKKHFNVCYTAYFHGSTKGSQADTFLL